MKNKEQEIFLLRENKHCYYDKRLILKIVEEVEAGFPRKIAVEKYKISHPSLNTWMQKYGSVHYHENIKRRSYTKLEKRTIITGKLTVKQAKITYNIKTEKIIREWLLQYKSEKVEICIENTLPMAKDKPSSKDLEKEALQEAELKIKALNTLINVAEDQLKIDIRKKSGAK